MPKKPRNWGRELWDSAVAHAEAQDNLLEYECGHWTRQKLYFLGSYLAQFTQAMIGNPNFDGYHYVDLFAGAGVCRVDTGNGVTKRYPGSAMLAAMCRKRFDRLILVEQDTERAEALDTRMSHSGFEGIVHIINKPVDHCMSEVIDAIPRGSLNVVFVDPYSLSISYDTIAKLASSRRCDFLILFADDMDIVRNVEAYYYPDPSSPLDRFLGLDSNWRDRWDQLQNRDAAHVRTMFSEVYRDQLAKLEYDRFQTKPILMNGRPLYRLVYVSQSDLGLKFWQIAEENEDFGGQKSLFPQ
ncbi:MAG: three-Cys-motif partner protein TcmP [Planctomycetota bacterium]